MTGSVFAGRPDSLASAKPEDALRPPKLTVANLALDLMRHIRVYRQNRLGLGTILAFLALRIIQHVAYDHGWKDGH